MSLIYKFYRNAVNVFENHAFSQHPQTHHATSSLVDKKYKQHIVVHKRHTQLRKLDPQNAWYAALLCIHVTVWRHVKNLYILFFLLFAFCRGEDGQLSLRCMAMFVTI